MTLRTPWVALGQLRVSLEVPGPPLGVPGEGPGGPEGRPRHLKAPSGDLRKSRGSADRWRTGGGPVANRLIRGGSGPPLKLLAKAKSDKNERRQRVVDLTRPGPSGPANIYMIYDICVEIVF